MAKNVDVAIIGAGSAGLFALSQVKRKTDNYVLINGGELGTTCARVGCMPSKVLIQIAEDFHRKSIFDREGIDGGEELSIDKEAAMEHVQDLRDVFVDKTLGVTDHMGDELIDGYASFKSNDTLEVNGEEIKCKNIIVATGSTPVIPEAWQAFRDKIITTDDFFESEDLPKSVAVIGLGSIGLEMGQSLCRLGVEVTGIDQLTTVAKLSDDSVNQQAVTVIGKEFPMWLGVAAEVSECNEGLRVVCGDKEVIVEKIFASLGRKPNLESLHLENTDLALDEKGIPEFDVYTMQSGEHNIFIAGDVNAERAILHEAGHEGRVAGFNAVNSITKFKRKTAFAITFSDPNIVTVGAQLDELDESEIAIGEIQFGPVGRALIMAKNRGILRVYANKSDGLLLGASMCCVRGENLGHLLAWSIQQSLSVFDLLKMPFYHPVIEEALQAALYDCLKQLDKHEELVELEKM